ncbi:MAG: RES domain-containing protein [Verrucomicrobiales bacterium]|nr:RES domain-containing protein [Verrucomicrobiales bacterium]
MKRTVWRIVKAKYAATAFSGEGAAKVGGRWNSRGQSVVYTSGTLSLAALEMLVHLQPPVPLAWIAIPCEFDESLAETLDESVLPANWRQFPAPPGVRALGDAWLKEARTPVLSVPSVVVPQERNFLLNPAHPDFERLSIGAGEPFALDTRLPGVV